MSRDNAPHWLGMASSNQVERIRSIRDRLDPDAPRDLRWLAAAIAVTWEPLPGGHAGLMGGQGAGKSTLAALIDSALTAVGRSICVLSLDDFYLTQEERSVLAERVHPLFETRGPPGTHDMRLLARTLARLGEDGSVEIPVFDKGRDDRVGTRVVEGPVDWVLLEGWCVGARTIDEAELTSPCNTLERVEDETGTWRAYQAARLGTEYVPIWECFDAWIFLRVPGLERVRQWRHEAEKSRPPDLRRSRIEIDRFVEHYERITLAMRRQPAYPGQWTVSLDENHGVESIKKAPASLATR